MLFLLPLFAACVPAPEPPQGVALTPRPAAPFALRDQHDALVTLDSLHGRVVVLTFLYTTCQTECPLIAARLRAAHATLATPADQLAFVAITTDPEGDTLPAITEYLALQHADDFLVYLRGARTMLEPLWLAYAVGGYRTNGYTTGHSTRILLLDRTGRERIHFSYDAEVDALVHDIRLLLKE